MGCGDGKAHAGVVRPTISLRYNETSTRVVPLMEDCDSATG